MIPTAPVEPMRAIAFVRPQDLKPHPRYAGIYGDIDAGELTEQIRASGWMRPLTVTPEHVIIGGHRRWKAALALGWPEVPVAVHPFRDRTAELEAMLGENAVRDKTREQKVREANAWKPIETEKAKERQLAGVSLSDGDPFSRSRGNVRDIVAKRVGLGSGVTYAKAAKVVRRIDAELKAGNAKAAEGWRVALNRGSVQGAYSLLKLPKARRVKVLDRLADGRATSVRDALEQIQTEVRQGGRRRFAVGEWVILALDEGFIFSAEERRWNGCWGRVEAVERGTVRVNFGSDTLTLYGGDLRPVEASPEWEAIAVRVLNLRGLDVEFSPVESAILDALQRQLEVNPGDAAYLDCLERRESDTP
ncbi:ParB N-terminal domain-containing protein [Lyngbya sp. CCY1209]|uniref:ParB/RepB/Spo0J family partition protein n=1 Tax=Lyngbya sp. CCY1209 TaxID=2886103 RepID=UPI002D1FFF9F|nr:ParB N-terminal domain-containing protein [Lyngbya sp. CCY1209]MEB3882809.1 ParB N-terminal domain-containing protein [Lyngbya sp. CCY1209]